MKKFYLLLLILALMIGIVSHLPVMAQDTSGGHWQLVETIEEPGDSSFNASYHGELCATHTVSWSNGMVSDSVYWPKTTSPDYYSYCENTRSMSYSGYASWTPPPQILYPGDEINLNGQVTIQERDTVWPAGVTWSVGYDKTHVCNVNPREGTEYCDNQIFKAKAGYSQISETGAQYTIGVGVTVTWGKVSPNGEAMNSTGRYTYVYEWVDGESSPAIPLQQQDPPSGQVDSPTSILPEIVLPPPPPPSENDGIWAVVIGGMAIMGVAAAGLATVGIGAVAAVLVARAKRRALDNNLEQLDEDEIVGYILELSTNEVVLMENNPQTVRVACWRVRANGLYEHAPEANIQIQPPSSSSNISVSPLSGMGQMDLTFNLAGESNSDTHQVIVTASAGGESESAVVSLFIVPSFEMVLTTHDGNTHLEIGEEGSWACAQIITDSADPTNDTDLKTANIRFRVEGANANWIELGDPIFRDKWQWVYLEVRSPYQGAQLERGNPVLIAEYHEDKILLTESMIIELQTEYELRVKLFDTKTSDIEYHRGQGEWQAPDMLVYWVNPSLGDTPVEPDFDYGFDDPPLRIEPPCLSLESFSEYAPHQYRMQFQVAQDLEQFFGEDLVEKDGLVKIVVEAIDDEQEKHFAEHDFQVRPMAIPLIYFWQDTPGQKVEGREHYGIQLNEGELISDGEDSLGVGAFLVRVDRMADFQQAYEHPLALSQPPGAELSGVNSSKYRLHEEPENHNPHRYAGRVKTDQEDPVFYLSQEHALRFRVDLALDQQRYPNYFFNQHPSQMQAEVKPIEVYLKLWVLPGAEVGTSEAGGFLYLPTKKAPLVGKELTLDIESSGGASLRTRQAVRKTDKNGLARWRLEYQGMTWKNYKNVSFTVRCGMPRTDGGHSGTEVRIDIGHNVTTLLYDLFEQRNNTILNLENPDWREGSGFLGWIGDMIFPDFLSGPVTNIFSLVSEEKYYPYVCEQLRNRVVEWLNLRRFGIREVNFDENKQTSMNGIDYGGYSMWLLGPVTHNFAGIFLSNINRSPVDDPRFIDPWWRQDWSHPIRRTLAGLDTKASQYAMQAGVLSALALLSIVAFKFYAFKTGSIHFAARIRQVVYAGTAAAGANVAVSVHLNCENLPDEKRYKHPGDDIILARRLLINHIPPVKPIVHW